MIPAWVEELATEWERIADHYERTNMEMPMFLITPWRERARDLREAAKKAESNV